MLIFLLLSMVLKNSSSMTMYATPHVLFTVTRAFYKFFFHCSYPPTLSTNGFSFVVTENKAKVHLFHVEPPRINHKAQCVGRVHIGLRPPPLEKPAAKAGPWLVQFPPLMHNFPVTHGACLYEQCHLCWILFRGLEFWHVAGRGCPLHQPLTKTRHWVSGGLLQQTMLHTQDNTLQEGSLSWKIPLAEDSETCTWFPLDSIPCTFFLCWLCSVLFHCTKSYTWMQLYAESF